MRGTASGMVAFLAISTAALGGCAAGSPWQGATTGAGGMIGRTSSVRERVDRAQRAWVEEAASRPGPG